MTTNRIQQVSFFHDGSNRCEVTFDLVDNDGRPAAAMRHEFSLSEKVTLDLLNETQAEIDGKVSAVTDAQVIRAKAQEVKTLDTAIMIKRAELAELDAKIATKGK